MDYKTAKQIILNNATCKFPTNISYNQWCEAISIISKLLDKCIEQEMEGKA